MAAELGKKIVAVIPAYNEAGKISKVVEKIRATNLVTEVVVVDDGSQDSTPAEAKAAGATVLVQPRNLGVGAAIRSGLDYAVEKNFDVVVIMGGDDQDNPHEMPRLLDPIYQENYDFIQGSRYLQGGATENIPLFRLITTKLFSFIIRNLLGFPVSDGTNGYRAFRTTLLKHPKIHLHQDWLNRYELEPYLYYNAVEQKFRVKEVPVTKRYPTTNIGYTKMIPILSWWSILRPLVYLRLGIRR